MIKSDVALFVWTAAFFVGTFVALQVMVWRSNRIIIGGTRTFAQCVMMTGVALTSVVTLFSLVLTFKVSSLAGLPFVLLYTLTIFTPLFMPALMVIEVILVAECVLTNRMERGAWSWHLGALLVCSMWAGILTLTSVVGQK